MSAFIVNHNHANGPPSMPDVSGKARRRPALSCAECRRLKLRCDREWPCQQCKKRGCASICPDGSLVPGRGNRFILAGTEDLHERIEALEEALTKASGNSNHPLLRNSLYGQRCSPSGSGTSSTTVRTISPTTPPPEELIDTIGTLAVGDDGHCKYFGNGAGSEFFMPEEETIQSQGDSRPSMLSPVFGHKQNPLEGSASFPPKTRDQLNACLPSKENALALCNNFFQHAGWLYDIVNREKFIDDTFMPTFYGPGTMPSQHRLALLFMVLSLGSLFDLSRPLDHPDADQYYNMARSCLSSEGCFGNTTIPALQALQLMNHYISNSHQKADAEVAWAQVGILVKLVQSMGLHRDGARWEFSEEELELRRKVFWEIHTHEVRQALCFGRPYSMNRLHIDCSLPNDPTARLNRDGSLGFGFHTVKYFIADKIMRVIDEAFCVTPPSYDTILQLDRDIRDFQKNMIPEHLQHSDDSPRSTDEDVTTILQRHVVTCLLNEALLYLHRTCFTRALVENAADPTATRFSPSFVATHRSSCTVIRALLDLAGLQPALVRRLAVYWFHAFSAAVVLASICIRSPGCSLARSAYMDLNEACDFFAAAEPSSRAVKGLPLLQRLRSKAYRALCEAGTIAPGLAEDIVPSDDEADVDMPHIKREDDECALLGGRIRLDRKSPPRYFGRVPRPPVVEFSPVPIGPVQPWASNGPPIAENRGPFANADPSLLDYLRRFNDGSVLNRLPASSAFVPAENDQDYGIVMRDGGMPTSTNYLNALFPQDVQQSNGMLYHQNGPPDMSTWPSYAMTYMSESR